MLSLLEPKGLKEEYPFTDMLMQGNWSQVNSTLFPYSLTNLIYIVSQLEQMHLIFVGSYEQMVP